MIINPDTVRKDYVINRHLWKLDVKTQEYIRERWNEDIRKFEKYFSISKELFDFYGLDKGVPGVKKNTFLIEEEYYNV